MVAVTAARVATDRAAAFAGGADRYDWVPMSVFTKILRAGEGRKLRALKSLVPDINSLEAELERLSDEDLAHRTVLFRERLERGEDLNDLLIDAFATVRELSLIHI